MPLKRSAALTIVPTMCVGVAAVTMAPDMSDVKVVVTERWVKIMASTAAAAFVRRTVSIRVEAGAEAADAVEMAMQARTVASVTQADND